MDIQIRTATGSEHECQVRIPQSCVDGARLSFPHRSRLHLGEGMVRHRGSDELQRTTERAAQVKESMERHLQGLGLLDETRRARSPIIAIGNRNLGNNPGFAAWSRAWEPPLFHLVDEPLADRRYHALCRFAKGPLEIREVEFSRDARVHLCGRGAVPDALEWCTTGTCILAGGRVREFEELIPEAYDIRHLLALDPRRPEDRSKLEYIYGITESTFDWKLFCMRATEARRSGTGRSRYYHSCIGVSDDEICLLLAEGTPEELGARLRGLGARDGLILDQGGSAGIWASWLTRSDDLSSSGPRGGFLCRARRYRPDGTSIIAFIVDSL